MPSIHGGGPQFQPLRPISPQVQATRAQPPGATSPQDTVQMARTPTQTSQNIQRQQNLTSEQAQLRIQQLIQNSRPDPTLERPPLTILQRGSMAAALAQTLAGQHVPENTQAQTAAGQQQTRQALKGQGPTETQDTSWQRSAQSGRRLKKEDQEGEFSMMEDSAGQGMSQQGSSQDQRSGHHKQKLLLEEQRRRDKEKVENPSFSSGPKIRLPAVSSPHRTEASARQTPGKTELKKPELKKSETQSTTVQRLNSLQPQKNTAPPRKAKADEWDL
jgi:hypothetical protein